MFSVSHNIKQFEAAFHALTDTETPRLVAMALNDTAYDGLDAVRLEMVQNFVSPVRWTLNAFMVWRADARTLQAKVMERPSVGSRHYLKVQMKGGARPRTGVEGALISRLKYGGHITAVTPAGGAKLDGSGNWSSGQRNQVMSGIKAQRDGAANTTTRSRKRNAKRAQYFVPKPGSKLSPGVWQRDGDRLSKILHFTKSRPTYSKRVDFHAAVERKTLVVYERHLALRLGAALR